MTNKKTSKKKSRVTKTQVSKPLETSQSQLDAAEKSMLLSQQSVQKAVENMQKNIAASNEGITSSVEQALKNQQEMVQKIIKEAQSTRN